MSVQTIKIGLSILAAAALIALGFFAWRRPESSLPVPAEQRVRVEVLRVIDGDTFETAGGEMVRLLGIDAPEKDRCYYTESRGFLSDLLEGEKVLLEKELSDQDAYGRLLRYVLIESEDDSGDNLLVNDYLVRQGFALPKTQPPDTRYRNLFISAQEEAMRENRGLWAACEHTEEVSERREGDDLPPSEEHIIKGNISFSGYGKIYLLPGCDNYETVKIDLSKGEAYFRTEAEAQAAGFRKATNCP